MSFSQGIIRKKKRGRKGLNKRLVNAPLMHESKITLPKLN